MLPNKLIQGKVLLFIYSTLFTFVEDDVDGSRCIGSESNLIAE